MGGSMDSYHEKSLLNLYENPIIYIRMCIHIYRYILI